MQKTLLVPFNMFSGKNAPKHAHPEHLPSSCGRIGCACKSNLVEQLHVPDIPYDWFLNLAVVGTVIGGTKNVLHDSPEIIA